MALPRVAMKYGYAGRPASSLPQLIQTGTLEGTAAVSETFALQAGGVYWLVTSSSNYSTDAYQGHATYQWQVPTGTTFGNTAGHSAAMVTQNTQRVSITANNNSTFTISNSANYRVKYALYKVV